MDRAGPRAAKRGRTRTEPARSGDARLRLFGLVVLCAKLALVPLAFDPAADVPFVVPKALLSHGLTYVLVGVLMGLLVLRGQAAIPRSPMHIPVLIFLSVSGLATAFAVDPMLALFGTHVRMLGLGSIADGVVTYFAAVTLVRTRRDVTALLGSMLAATLVVIIYEAIQMSGRDPFSWTIDGSQRPFSTFGQPTTLGLYLVTVAVGVFGLVALTPVLRRPVRAALLAYAGLLLLAAGLSGTRSVAIGALAAAAAFALAIWLKHPSATARRLSMLSGLGAAAVLAVLLLVTPLGARLLATPDAPAAIAVEDSTFGQIEESTAARIAIYRMALGMIKERPILGYGPDSFAAGVPAHRPAPAPAELRKSLATSAHSWIAAIGTSSGIAGLLAFGAILVLAGFAAIRAPFSVITTAGAVGAAAYLGAGVTTVSALETDTLFWLAMAAIAGATAAATRADGPVVVPSVRAARRDRPASGSRTAVAWSLVAVGVLMMATGVTALGASRLANQSVSLRQPATAAGAIDLASRATAADPNRAEYWEQLALAYVVAARWADASSAFQRAAKLAPYDIRYLSDGIQVQLVLANNGDSQALARAADLADRAVRIDPNNPGAQLTKATIAAARKDVPTAAAAVDRAVVLDPNSTNVQLYVTATQIYVTAVRIDDAIRVGRTGVAVLGPTKRSVPLRVELARALLAGGRDREAVAQLTIALGLTPGDQAATRLLATIADAASATNAAAKVSASPVSAAPGSAITVTWSGIELPTVGDWIGLFPSANPDASYVAWHLTTAESSGTMTLTVPGSAPVGSYNVRLFLNYANTSVATSDTIVVR